MQVFAGKYKNGEQTIDVAIKYVQVNLDETWILQVEKEASMAVQGCPNTVKYFGYFVKHVPELYKFRRFGTFLVFERLYGSVLDKVKDKLDTLQTLTVLRDTAEALQCIHSKGYIHEGMRLHTINRQVTVTTLTTLTIRIITRFLRWGRRETREHHGAMASGHHAGQR